MAKSATKPPKLSTISKKLLSWWLDNWRDGSTMSRKAVLFDVLLTVTSDRPEWQTTCLLVCYDRSDKGFFDGEPGKAIAALDRDWPGFWEGSNLTTTVKQVEAIGKAANVWLNGGKPKHAKKPGRKRKKVPAQ